MPTTIEPPKQSDQSKVSNAALSGWMDGLKEGAASTQEPPPDKPPTADATKIETKPAEAAKPAETKATTTATETAADNAEESPDRWPRSSKDWQAFIKIRNDNYSKRDTRIKELEGKLTEAEKAAKGLPTDAATFETIKSERVRFEQESKDLSERLRLAAIESHPKFKAYYDGKVNAQIELAKRIVGADKADAVAEALRLPDGAWKTSRIEELSVEISSVAASRLGSVLNAIEEIDLERKGEVARAKTDFESAQAKANAETTAARERTTAEANARFEAVVKQASDPKEGFAMFQARDGDEAWNKAVKERIDGARQTLFGGNGNGTSPDTLIRKALVAEAFPVLLESYNTLLTQVGALKEQVSKLTSATPTIEARPASAAGAQDNRLPAGSRPMAVAADWMRGLKEASQG